VPFPDYEVNYKARDISGLGNLSPSALEFQNETPGHLGKNGLSSV